MNLRPFVVVIAVVLAACMTPPTRVASLASSNPPDETFELLQSQAFKCWPSTVTAIKRGIAVRSRIPLTIEARPVRWGYSTGRETPFAVVAVEAGGTGSVISVDEDPLDCSLVQGCPVLGLKQDVEHWLNGDLSCQDYGPQLLRLGLGV